MNKTISILVPVKNEEAALPLLFQELDKRLVGLVEKYDFHVLVLDDGSTDSSADVVKRYDSNLYSIGLCSFTRNFGKEAAIAAGLERCESDVYIIMDSDLQHPPSLILEMITKWEEGYKIVEGVKLDRGKESLLYRLFSMIFYKALNSMGSLDLKNLSDYKLIDRELVNIIRSLPEKSRFFRGLIDWMGYPKHQIPFHVPDREAGTTSWSSWQLIKFSLSAISSFSSAPLQFVTVIGVAMLAISVLLGSVTLYQWGSGQAVTGFTTVIILLLAIGSMLMVSLGLIGLIGLYLARIYEEIKGRPVYMIKEEIQTSRDSEGK